MSCLRSLTSSLSETSIDTTSLSDARAANSFCLPHTSSVTSAGASSRPASLKRLRSRGLAQEASLKRPRSRA
jgi:hypothetical protein